MHCKHLREKHGRQLLRTRVEFPGNNQEQFSSELCIAMVAVNIPWKKLDSSIFKGFLTKYTSRKIPDESTLMKNYCTSHILILAEETVHPQLMKVPLSTELIYQGALVKGTQVRDLCTVPTIKSDDKSASTNPANKSSVNEIIKDPLVKETQVRELCTVPTTKNDDKSASTNPANKSSVNETIKDPLVDVGGESSRHMEGKPFQWSKRYKKRYPGKCHNRKNHWNSIMFPGENIASDENKDLNVSKLPPTIKVQKWLETNDSELQECDKSVIQALMSGALPQKCEDAHHSLSEDDEVFLSVSQMPLYLNADRKRTDNYRNRTTEVPLVSLNSNGVEPENHILSSVPSTTDPYTFISSQKSQNNTGNNKRKKGVASKKKNIRRNKKPFWKNISYMVRDYDKANNKKGTKMTDNSIFCANLDPNNTFDNLLKNTRKTTPQIQRNIPKITEKQHGNNVQLELPQPLASQSSFACDVDINNTFDKLLATTTKPEITTVKNILRNKDVNDEIYIFKSQTESVDKLCADHQSVGISVATDEHVKGKMAKGRRTPSRYTTRSRTVRKRNERLPNINESGNGALESLTHVFAEIEDHRLLTSSQVDREKTDEENPSRKVVSCDSDLQRESSDADIANCSKEDNMKVVGDNIAAVNISTCISSPGWSHLDQLKKDFRSPKKPALKALNVSLGVVCLPKKNVSFVENNFEEQSSNIIDLSPAIDDGSVVLKVNQDLLRNPEIEVHSRNAECFNKEEPCSSKPYKPDTTSSPVSNVICLSPNPKDDIEMKTMTCIIHSTETAILHANSVTSFYQQKLGTGGDERTKGFLKHYNMPLIIPESEDNTEKNGCAAIVEKMEEEHILLGSEMEKNVSPEKLQEDQTCGEHFKSTAKSLQYSVEPHKKVYMNENKENVNIYKYTDNKANYQTLSKCADLGVNNLILGEDMQNIISTVDINKCETKTKVFSTNKMPNEKISLENKEKIASCNRQENIYCHSSPKYADTKTNDTNIQKSFTDSLIVCELKMPTVCDPKATSSNICSNPVAEMSPKTVGLSNNQEMCHHSSKYKQVTNPTSLRQRVSFLKLGSMIYNRRTCIARFVALGSLVPKRKRRQLNGGSAESEPIPIITWERDEDLPKSKRHCLSSNDVRSSIKLSGSITPPTATREVEVQTTPSLQNRWADKETVNKLPQTNCMYFMPGMMPVFKRLDSQPTDTATCVPDSCTYETVVSEMIASMLPAQLNEKYSLTPEKTDDMSISDNCLVPELKEDTETLSLHDTSTEEEIVMGCQSTFKESASRVVDASRQLIFDKACSQHRQITTPEQHSTKLKNNFILDVSKNNNTNTPYSCTYEAAVSEIISASMLPAQLNKKYSPMPEKTDDMSISDNCLVPELKEDTETLSLHDPSTEEEIMKGCQSTFKESASRVVDASRQLIFDEACSQYKQITIPEQHSTKLKNNFSLDVSRNNNTNTPEVGVAKVSGIISLTENKPKKTEPNAAVEIESDSESEIIDLIGSDDASENFIPGTYDSRKCDNADIFYTEDEELQKIDSFIKEDLGLVKTNRYMETKALNTEVEETKIVAPEKMATDEIVQEVQPRWSSSNENNVVEISQSQTPKQHAPQNTSFTLSEDIVEATPPKLEASFQRQIKSRTTLSGPKRSLIQTRDVADSDKSPRSRLPVTATRARVDTSFCQSPLPVVRRGSPPTDSRFHRQSNIASVNLDGHTPATPVLIRPEVCPIQILEPPANDNTVQLPKKQEPNDTCQISAAFRAVHQNEVENINPEYVAPATMSTVRHTRNVKHDETQEAVFVCSGLQPDLAGRVKALAKIVGAKFSDVFTKKVTHLVVLVNDEGKTTKTLKYIQTVASGKWVVAFAWVNDCIKAKTMVPEDEYEALDSSGSSGPQMSRLRSGPLLMDFTFYWNKPISTIPSCTLKEILTLCGGNIVEAPAEFDKKQGLYFIYLVETLEDTEEEQMVDMLQHHHAVTVCIDWVLDCIGCWQLVSLMGYVSENLSQDDLRRYDYPEDLLADEDEDEDDIDQEPAVD